MAERYVVAGAKPWNGRIFEGMIRRLPGDWTFVAAPEELTPERLDALRPRYIFFMHWSWIVPPPIVQKWECVCFHMTDVPYGRGGSPLQNLIVRGHRATRLTALRMVSELDAGPVYAKRDLCLEGNAEEIYIRASELSAKMIAEIAGAEPTPVPQEGEPVIFRRRKPSESGIPEARSLRELYDFIRMLDAEGYPHAFLQTNGFRYEFRRAAFKDGHIVADVIIRPIEGESSR